MFKKFIIVTLLILMSFFFILCGVIISKPFLYVKIKDIVIHIVKGNFDDAAYYFFGDDAGLFKHYDISNRLEELGFNNCDIPKINYSDLYNSRDFKYSLIIGHAYGIENDSISPDLINFFKSNQLNFNRIYFTGDVLNEPSPIKWKKFINFMQQYVSSNNFIIVPGNHDVGWGDNNIRDIFFQTFNRKFPNLEKRYNNYMILIDSTLRPLNLDEKVLDLILDLNPENKSSNLFVLSHHLLRPYPISIANSTHDFKSTILNDLKKITIKLEQFKNVYFISGDTGNNISSDCLKIKNTYFISSGLTSGKYKNKDNNILVFDEEIGNIFMLNLSKASEQNKVGNF